MPTEPATKKPVNFGVDRGAKGPGNGAGYAIRGIEKPAPARQRRRKQGSAVEAKPGGRDI